MGELSLSTNILCKIFHTFLVNVIYGCTQPQYMGVISNIFVTSLGHILALLFNVHALSRRQRVLLFLTNFFPISPLSMFSCFTREYSISQSSFHTWLEPDFPKLNRKNLTFYQIIQGPN